MEKTIEILLVATVVLMTAVVVIFMLQGRVGGFDDFLQNQNEDAQCSIGETKFSNAVECNSDGTVANQNELGDIRNDYPDCNVGEWTANCGDSEGGSTDEDGSGSIVGPRLS